MAETNKLKTLALTLLITGAIDIIRNLPASALFGSTVIFFFLFAGIFFLAPTALISAELNANVNEGGIYHWVRAAFGDRTAFLAIWLQWVNNLFWFPTILSFVAGTAAYLINPVLAQNKLYLVGCILFVFWSLTLINLRGLKLSAKFTAFSTLIGLILPMLLIVSLGAIWIFQGHPLQMHITAHNLLPEVHNTNNWMALTAIILGFTGMELTAVHVNDVHEPHITFPRALTYATIIVLTCMTLGSLAIAYVLPYSEISMVSGTIQTFRYFFSAYHLSWLLPLVTLMLVIGSLGCVVSWVIPPIKGIAQAGNHGFLPPFFTLLNRRGMPARLLVLQALIVSLVCSAFLLLPTVSASYWLLTNLSTQLYLIMYMLMFAAAIRLRFSSHFVTHANVIPGGKFGTLIVCLFGIVGCTITMYVGLIPPEGLSNLDGHHYAYLTMLGIGVMMMLIPILPFYWYHQSYGKRHRLKALEVDSEAA